ncbi:MAG: bifunctional glycosyltransferase family 2/GtrA family protein [Lachnospiraceae bacterium]|nr:bifunctional glycosyltransferase family 2/GtrA family protein [Lachnospiraceae bacterium]
MNYLIVIPALNPGDALIKYVDDLQSHGYQHILVVDDGSSDRHRYIFDEISAKTGCEILRHEVNMGKGRALKDAMKHFLSEYAGRDFGGIITADSDGQHTVEDVGKVARALSENPDSLILGARDFNAGNVPPKSRFGNKCTVVALKLFIGGNISDTQTGLRGIPSSMLEKFSELSGERFEYETVMLINAIHSGADIKEVPIETVYINANSETHFNPLKDSVKIYIVIFGTFFRYTMSSLSSFLVDYGLFLGIYHMLTASSAATERAVWIATGASRICSSLFNYTLNKKVVFKSRRGPITLVMYYILCVIQAASSAALVNLVSSFGAVPVQAAKILVDCILFVISYRLQKGIIFKTDQ